MMFNEDLPANLFDDYAKPGNWRHPLGLPEPWDHDIDPRPVCKPYHLIIDNPCAEPEVMTWTRPAQSELWVDRDADLD
jgi:hypothetical protein